MDESRSRRSYWFLVGATLLALMLLPFLWSGERVRRHRATVKAIEALGGSVGQETNEFAERWCPERLISLLGNGFFANIIWVNLSGSWVTDADLDELRGLTQLRELNLSNNDITDAGLERLKQLTQLNSLNLSGTQITDVGLEHLKGLTQFTELRLHGTQITDVGLEHLCGLTQLYILDLSNTKITDVGLEHLNGLTQLDFLDLSGTHVTDQGVKKLQETLPDCTLFTDQ